MDLTAYSIGHLAVLPLEPGDLKRAWTEGNKRLTSGAHPGMARANQAGWLVTSPIELSVVWNGEVKPHAGIDIYSPDSDRKRVGSLFSNAFGHGILTINIPYLFRTPPGVGLWVRGPANHFFPGLQPLDGLVETDWLQSTFTMNWRVLTPHQRVTIRKGDPLCMLVPYPLDLLEMVKTELLERPEPPPAMPAVNGATWQHVIPGDRPGLATANTPGKVRMRLKRFEVEKP